MAQIRSKQISDFLSSITWANITSADNVTIANAYDIKQQFDVVDADVTSLETYISSEVVSLEGIDAGLASEISTERERVDAILESAEADKDSFAEIVSLINAVDTENDSAFASYVLNNNASVDSLEGALSTEIAATNADVTSLDTRVSLDEAALAAEITRATGAEEAISDALTAEINTTNGEVNDLVGSVNSLELVDADLASDITAETQRATDAEGSLEAAEESTDAENKGE